MTWHAVAEHLVRSRVRVQREKWPKKEGNGVDNWRMQVYEIDENDKG